MPKYPAVVAQKTAGSGTRPSALSNTRQRHARRNSAAVAIAITAASPGAEAPEAIRTTSPQSMPRRE